MKEIENKIKNIKILFKDYKERNLGVISIYKLLINNYKYFNNIKNYNIINNIIINDNFDLSTSEYFIKEENKKANECFASKYNKLYCFYNNKLHIKTKEYSNHFITQKYCLKNNVKKCIIMNDKIIAFIFSNDNHIYFLDKDKEVIFKKKYNCKYIYDIYPLNSKELIVIDKNFHIKIYNIENKKIINKGKNLTTQCKDNVFNFIVPNLINKDNFFMISNNNKIFSIYYYINNDTISLIYRENKNSNINCLFTQIIKNISESKIYNEDENKLGNLFREQNNINL